MSSRTTPNAPDLATAVYRLDVILGCTTAVLVALLGLCAALAKKSRTCCKMWSLSFSWGSVPPSPAVIVRPPAPFAREFAV